MLNLKQYIVSSCSTHIKNIYRTTITVCVNFRLESVIVRQAAKIDILIPGTFNYIPCFCIARAYNIPKFF